MMIKSIQIGTYLPITHLIEKAVCKSVLIYLLKFKEQFTICDKCVAECWSAHQCVYFLNQHICLYPA